MAYFGYIYVPKLYQALETFCQVKSANNFRYVPVKTGTSPLASVKSSSEFQQVTGCCYNLGLSKYYITPPPDHKNLCLNTGSSELRFSTLVTDEVLLAEVFMKQQQQQQQLYLHLHYIKFRLE